VRGVQDTNAQYKQMFQSNGTKRPGSQRARHSGGKALCCAMWARASSRRRCRVGSRAGWRAASCDRWPATDATFHPYIRSEVELVGVLAEPVVEVLLVAGASQVLLIRLFQQTTSGSVLGCRSRPFPKP